MPAPHSSVPVETPDETLELFGRPSGWMLYWGTGTIVLFLLALLLFTAWVDYPDKVITEVVITTSSPPVPLVTRRAGVVAQVLAEEGAQVKSDEVLVVLDNPARLDNVQLLEEKLPELNSLTHPIELLNLQLPEQLQLGLLGRDYTELVNLGNTIGYWLQRQKNGQRAQRIAEQLQQTKAQQKVLKEQLNILEQETVIAKRNLVAYDTLVAHDAASQLEMDIAQTTYLRTKRQEKEQENRLVLNLSQEAALRESQLVLGEALNDQVMETWLSWQAQLRKLQQGLYEWQEQYLLRAPVDGQVSFYTTIYPGLFLENQQLVIGIVSETGDSTYLAEGQLAQLASGKIEEGASAYIELDAYPARQFGQLPAQVQQIALTPGQDGYRILLSLPDGLHTSYGQPLPPRQQMRGIAIILSEEQSLLSRLLQHLRSVGNK